MRPLANFLTVTGSLIAAVVWAQDSSAPSASCSSPQAIDEPCKIEWKFPKSSKASYWVQQFEPRSATWRNLDATANGSMPEGVSDRAVEAGSFYRVVACDDVAGAVNCLGSTMAWAAVVVPPERMDLIPSRVAAINPEKGDYIGGVFKNAPWIVQVAQYNVNLMINAISYADVSQLPEMTPVAPPSSDGFKDPMAEVQFNVYAFYLAEQGRPIDSLEPAMEPRAPHEHPERDER